MPEEAGSTGHNAALQLRSESEAHIHQFIGLNLEDAVALAGRLNLAFRISNSADGWMTMITGTTGSQLNWSMESSRARPFPEAAVVGVGQGAHAWLSTRCRSVVSRVSIGGVATRCADRRAATARLPARPGPARPGSCSTSPTESLTLAGGDASRTGWATRPAAARQSRSTPWPRSPVTRGASPAYGGVVGRSAAMGWWSSPWRRSCARTPARDRGWGGWTVAGGGLWRRGLAVVDPR